MTRPTAGGGGGVNDLIWPLSIKVQAAAIVAAVKKYSVPLKVFMGMYNNETGLGANVTFSSAGAVGPFQFTSADKNTGVLYPMTNVPTAGEFRQQAMAAAALLAQGYRSLGSWRNALAAYNAGDRNYKVAFGYADQALAFQIPANWKAALGNPDVQQGGTAGQGGTGGLPSDTGNTDIRVGDTTNPNEDYWTAINRMAQVRYWYFFSDGEVAYLADGDTLMKQAVAVYLDRLGDRDRIHHMEFTFDNPLALDTPIPTPSGWTTMGEIQAGDMVLGADGRPIRVAGVSPVFLDHRCYRVRFSDHTSIVADADHRWRTIALRRDAQTEAQVAHQRYLGTRTTQQIYDTLTVPRPNRENDSPNHRIPMAAPLVLPDVDLPIDPYVFGYWLGDGNARAPYIATCDEDMPSLLAQVRRAGYSHSVRRYASSGTGFMGDRDYPSVALSLFPAYRAAHRNEDSLTCRLKRLDVYANKHIPPVYLRASLAQRIALLQGVLDSDGTIGRGVEVAFANERLARDVLELVRSLGFRPILSHRAPRGRSRPLRLVNFPASAHLTPFRLPRKAARYLERVATRAHHRAHRTIVAVDEVPSVPVKCIAVESDNHLFLAGDGFCPTHNTAWRYFQTHKVRRRIRRNTGLAKVPSPVEVTLELICNIDAVRGGDVMHLTGCGPGDGLWLVGECRRSVFSIFSEITLVQALHPLPEMAGVNANNVLAGIGGPGSGGYVNPVPSWLPSRVDMGVDGTLRQNYRAPGDSVIVVSEANSPGWAGGGYLAGRLTGGSQAGHVWYVSEGVTPSVRTGQPVQAGADVTTSRVNPYNGIVGNIETGWADPSQPLGTLASVTGGYYEGANTAAGQSYNRFIKSLGGAGGSNFAPLFGHLPPGYP